MLFSPFFSAPPPLTDTIFFFAYHAVLYSFYLQIYNIHDKKKKKKSVCMYVCMCVCSMYVCMYVCMYICMYVCSMYACEWVCLAHSSYS